MRVDGICGLTIGATDLTAVVETFSFSVNNNTVANNFNSPLGFNLCCQAQNREVTGTLTLTSCAEGYALENTYQTIFSICLRGPSCKGETRANITLALRALNACMWFGNLQDNIDDDGCRLITLDWRAIVDDGLFPFDAPVLASGTVFTGTNPNLALVYNGLILLDTDDYDHEIDDDVQSESPGGRGYENCVSPGNRTRRFTARNKCLDSAWNAFFTGGAEIIPYESEATCDDCSGDVTCLNEYGTGCVDTFTFTVESGTITIFELSALLSGDPPNALHG